MSDVTIGVLASFAASVAWALANVSVQRSARLVGIFRGLLWAQVAGGAVAALLALVMAQGQRTSIFAWASALTGGTLAWLAGAGLASLIAYLALFYALEHGRISIAVPIMSGWAVISTGISVLVFREPVRALQLVGAALVIGGVVVISRHAHETAARETAGAPKPMGSTMGSTPGSTPASDRAPGGSVRRPPWLLASFAAAVGFGLMIPAIGRVTPAFGRLGTVAAVFFTDILLGLPLAAVLRVNLRPPPRAALVPVALAGFFETAGFVCIALAIGRAPLAVVSPLASLSSALTVLYAWAVLRERPSRAVIMGAALVCAGVIALAL